ncbi:MAG: aquaporin [Actinomycetota bacterium]|nr:aquaporin [Actinomycetota bacterium]
MTGDENTLAGGSQPESLSDEAMRAELGRRLRMEAPWAIQFRDPSQEIKRLFSELFGTFFLVVVAAGAPTVSAVGAGQIGRAAAVTAPGLMVLSIILFMGRVSGAHLNPVVSIAFALRKDFPWRRVPGYIVVQAAGAILAGLFLYAMFGKVGLLGATVPGKGITDLQAFFMETVLTLGLVSTILGTASKAQNVGTMSAVGVGSYIALAGLWASPISGASMNPVRSLGPAVALGDFSHLWVYFAGPLAGALIAVLVAFILRGPAGFDSEAQLAAQGKIK